MPPRGTVRPFTPFSAGPLAVVEENAPAAAFRAFDEAAFITRRRTGAR